MFDVLQLCGDDLTSSALGVRRRALEKLLDGLHPCLQLVAQTADASLAEDWLSLPSLEGVVAKRIDRPYVSGRVRDWVKSSATAPSTAWLLVSLATPLP